MRIRTAAIEDLDRLVEIEQICFPAAEAASRDSILERLRVFPNHFYVLEDEIVGVGGENIVGFINGMVSDSPAISDEMFKEAERHNENGSWQIIFGLDVLPEYRRNGRAAALMNRMIDSAKDQGRMGCVLTCKDFLIHYYEKFGYKNLGLSKSTHGGAKWYDMLLEF